MLWAIVMAGGRGTRFWPESRNEKPKQFLHLFGKTTLLEQTVSRISKIIPSERILIITQQEKVSLVRKLAKIPKSNVIGEPVGRNTAPCAVLGAAWVAKRDPKAVLALLPADHRIERVHAFCKVLVAAAHVASCESAPVTFGIRPAFAFTGYGYLETARVLGRAKGFPFYAVKKFYEKPSRQKAECFYRSKRFFWNSGMFVWRADDLLLTASRFLPSAYRLARKITERDLLSRMKLYYPKMPGISIDYGLMEKLRGRIRMVAADIGWNDVGGWQSLKDFLPKDSCGNVVCGEAILVGSENNVVKSQKRLIALVGVRDHVVVDTKDALLVCSKHQTESIRQVVKRLKAGKWKACL